MKTTKKQTGDRQKLTEQVTQAGLQLLPLIMNNIPQAVFWKDRDLVYLGCNQAFADDAGFSSPEEIVGKTDFDMPWTDQAELYRADDRLVMENGESKLNYEEPQTTPDDSIIWLSTSKIPVYENGKVVAVLGMYEDITERKQAENALKESEEKFRAIADNTAIGLFIHQGGIMRYVGREAARMLGYEPENVVGRSIMDFIYPDERQHIAEIAQQRTAGENVPNHYETRLLRKDGSALDVILYSTLVDYEGKVATQGAFLDLTERKQAEEANERGRQRFQMILETIRIPTIISRLSDGIVLYANHALAQVSQVNLDKLIGFKTGNFYANPDDRKTVLESLRQYGHIDDFEVQFQRTDGSLYWALLSSRIVEYEGEPCVLSTYMDITTLKQANETIRRQQELWNQALAALTYPFYIIDANDYSIQAANPAALESGAKGATTCYALTHHEDAPCLSTEHPCPLKQVIKTKQPFIVEHIHLDRDGRPRNMEVHGYPIQDDDGNVVQMIEYSLDITERKRLQEQLQEEFEQRGYRVQVSTEISQQISQATELGELFDRVVTLTKEQLGYYHTQLLRYDPNQNAVVLIAGYGETGQKMLAEGHHMPMGSGLIGTAAATGETVMRSKLEEDPDWQPNPLLPDTRGEIAVPIKLGDEVLGVLDVQSGQAGVLSDDDRLLLEGLCGQIAIAIDQTRLRQEMGERLEEIHRMNRAMSHEGWQVYRQTESLPAGFIYDQMNVVPIKATESAKEPFISQPIAVPGGEAIGTLSIADDPQHPDR